MVDALQTLRYVKTGVSCWRRTLAALLPDTAPDAENASLSLSEQGVTVPVKLDSPDARTAFAVKAA